MDKIKVIVTGAGGPASIGFSRSLNDVGGYELIGVDCDKYHLALAEVDHKYLVPRVDDPSYLKTINSIADKHAVDFLHSQPDVEIELLSEMRDDLNVKTNFPPKEVVRTCMSKWDSYKAWRAYGLPVPGTMFINNKKDLKKAFKKFGPKIWIRNIKGAAGKDSLPTSNYKEAVEWIDACDGWGEFNAAELLSDKTITWTSIWDNGVLLVAQTRARAYWEFSNRARSGVTGLTGTGITASDAEVDKIALGTIFAITKRPHGIFSVDMTYSFDGVPNPTEINIARFFTTHYFFTKAGLNLPDIFVRTSLGLRPDLPNKQVNPLSDGLAWVRGIDSIPVLTTMEKINSRELELKEKLS